MSRHRFRLARVQRVRAIEERVARTSFAAAERMALEAESAVENTRRALVEARDALAEERAPGPGPLAPRRTLVLEGAADRLLAELAGRREAALTRRDQAERLRLDWRRRKAEHKALEELRRRGAVQHASDELRRETRELDEVALMRSTAAGSGSRSRRPRGGTD